MKSRGWPLCGGCPYRCWPLRGVWPHVEVGPSVEAGPCVEAAHFWMLAPSHLQPSCRRQGDRATFDAGVLPIKFTRPVKPDGVKALNRDQALPCRPSS